MTLDLTVSTCASLEGDSSDPVESQGQYSHWLVEDNYNAWSHVFTKGEVAQWSFNLDATVYFKYLYYNQIIDLAHNRPSPCPIARDQKATSWPLINLLLIGQSS